MCKKLRVWNTDKKWKKKKKISYQRGQGPEIPWWERKGRRKQYVRFACRVQKTQKKYSREVEFKILLQFSFNSCSKPQEKEKDDIISWVYKISKNPESFWERKWPRKEKNSEQRPKRPVSMGGFGIYLQWLIDSNTTIRQKNEAIILYISSSTQNSFNNHTRKCSDKEKRVKKWEQENLTK